VTTKAKEDVKATGAPAPAAQDKPAVVEEKTAEKPEKAPGECVVDDGTKHNGPLPSPDVTGHPSGMAIAVCITSGGGGAVMIRRGEPSEEMGLAEPIARPG
jgi:hypothetical protein